jgi:predicted alpha/beta hydrolase family esterase
MKNAIILHGGPTKEEYYDKNFPSLSNQHWLPWLQRQLQLNDIPAATPEVPDSYKRDWQTWAREVERFDITPQTILVGHSTGAGFFVKYLSIHPEIQVDKLVLVAPWLDPFKELKTNFFKDFDIDPDLAKRTAGVIIFNSNNDMDSVQETAKHLRAKIEGVTYKEFNNYGHFCYEDMRTDKFPELLETILNE